MFTPLPSPPYTIDAASPWVLLTDGSILFRAGDGPDQYQQWLCLSPPNGAAFFQDILHGTWSHYPLMAQARIYPTVAMLPNGRVFVYGGTIPSDDPEADDLPQDNTVEIFTPGTDPMTDPDRWIRYPGPPEWDRANAGRTDFNRSPMSCVLGDGTVLVGKALGSEEPDDIGFTTAIFDPQHLDNPWRSAETGGYYAWRNTETNHAQYDWTLLPGVNGTVLSFGLAADAEGTLTTTSQRYRPIEHGWTAPQPESVSGISFTILIPTGDVLVFLGSNPLAAVVYSPDADPARAGSWGDPVSVPSMGDVPPQSLSLAASILPGGQVLFVVLEVESPSDTLQGQFIVFDPPTSTMRIIESASSDAPLGSMLLLASGNVLYNRQLEPNGLSIYSPGADDVLESPRRAWRPQLDDVPTEIVPGGDYPLTGRQLSGLAQATTIIQGTYYCPTNYPLVFLRNHSSGLIWCCRSHDHSSMAVATQATSETTHFTVPAECLPGPADVWVVTNGIPSDSVTVTVSEPTTLPPSPEQLAILMLAGNLADGTIWVFGPGKPHHIPPLGPENPELANVLLRRIKGDLLTLQSLVTTADVAAPTDSGIPAATVIAADRLPPAGGSPARSPSRLPWLMSLIGLFLVSAVAAGSLLIVIHGSGTSFVSVTILSLAGAIGAGVALIGLGVAARRGSRAARQ